MATRSEVYRNLRRLVSDLGALQGQKSTNDLIAGLDKIWRGLLRTKKVMIDTLKDQGQIISASEIQLLDFYSTYCQIHVPSARAIKCDNCLSRINFDRERCPYCNHLTINKLETRHSAVIDFSVTEMAPNWDINFDPTEMLKEPDPLENLEEIKPITKRDDIIGPKGTDGGTKTKRKDSLSTSTRKMIVWMRKREFGKMVPYSLNQLNNLIFYDLRTIATLMPNYDPKEVSGKDIKGLIQFILGAQGGKPINPGPPPYGTIPKIESPL